MKTKDGQTKALIHDMISRAIELESEYASREIWVSHGKIGEWQQKIDAAWKRLIEAETLLKDYISADCQVCETSPSKIE